MQEAAFPYRAYFNRNRTVIFLHPKPAEIADLIDIFQEQGFITNVALNLGALSRLVATAMPDTIVAHADVGRGPAQVAIIRDMAMAARIYLLTDDAPALAEVVKAVRHGALSVFVQPVQVTAVLREVQDDLAEDLRPGKGTTAKVGGMNSLSPREREVLQIILKGGTNKEAAKIFHISPRTVEVHRAHAMKKLGARNTVEMVRIALGK